MIYTTSQKGKAAGLASRVELCTEHADQAISAAHVFASSALNERGHACAKCPRPKKLPPGIMAVMTFGSNYAKEAGK